MVQIRKLGYLNFFHYWDGIEPTAEYSASDLVITFDGNIIYLRATNGRVIFLKDGFNYTDVEVYDDTTGQSWTSFSSVIQLQQKLIDLGHPAYPQQGIIIQPENFTDLSDTPSTYVGQASKSVAVKADETGLEFVIGGGGSGVESVTGDSVDNTDPLNPVVNAIPLSGTEVGSPVTGPLNTESITGLSSVQGDLAIGVADNYDLEDTNRKGIIYLTSSITESTASLAANSTTNPFAIALVLTSPESGTQTAILNVDIIDDSGFKGFEGLSYYGANYDDNTYVQKKYVDDSIAAIPDTISIFGSDLDTSLVVGEKDLMFAQYNFTLTNYWTGALTEVPTGAALTVDIKKNGVSITSVAASIDDGEATSLTGTQPTLTTTSFTKGDKISREITSIGSTNAGKGLQINFEIIKT